MGYGTRQMAKTVAAVAEAAGASAQSPASHTAAPAAIPQRPPTPASPPSAPGRTIPKLPSARELGGRAQHLRHSVWGPLAVFSGALWLRVTGTFFALIAATMATSAWRQRFDLYTAAGPAAARHFWIFVIFALLFGYFAVSGFVRANARERRAQNTR